MNYCLAIPLFLLLLLGQVFLLTGCRNQKARESTPKTDEKSSEGRTGGFVEVTGHVVKPVTIEVGVKTLSLKESVLRAGGPQVTGLNEAGSKVHDDQKSDRGSQQGAKSSRGSADLIVVLSEQDVRWYIPWAVVENESLGQKNLSSGAAVTLKHPSELNLDIAQTVPAGVAFSVQGIVERSGDYQTKHPSEKFMQVMTAEYAGAARLDRVQADTVILTRSSPGKTACEVYLIPIGNVYVQGGLLRFRIQQGDRFEFVRLENVRDLEQFEADTQK